VRRLILLTLVLTGLLFAELGPAAYAAPAVQVKELNFVFLHGAGGNSGAMQLLSDCITAKLPDFIASYEANNPGIKINVDSLNRNYPNNVDINTWANNIASSIKTYFNQNNLILIGHSMGGKTALYTAAHNIGNLTNNIAAVVTINSPVKNLNKYYFTGGANYWQAAWYIPQDRGVLNSLSGYDASADGEWVGTNKHWLALTSAESSPLSKQFDVQGFDPLPRDMDDTIVPISAQYADGADVVYYGEYAHSTFTSDTIIASYLAEFILRYIFGGTIEYSVLADQGNFKHTAGWFPVSYRWDETTGESPIDHGTVLHKNNSFKWQEWEDIVGPISRSETSDKRSSFQTKLTSTHVLSALMEAHWLTANNKDDAQLYLRTRAAPLTTVRVDWNINGYQEVLGKLRDHYEVEITTGTPFTDIEDTTWVSDDPLDFRLQVKSKAEGPLRWFDASWRTYFREYFPRKVIDEMPITPTQ
jgi:pimeloyl-ACP methyl ester carboxylesterase